MPELEPEPQSRLHMSCRNSTTSTIPGCTLVGSENQEWNWDSNQGTLIWNVSIPISGLTTRPNSHPIIHCYVGGNIAKVKGQKSLGRDEGPEKCGIAASSTWIPTAVSHCDGDDTCSYHGPSTKQCDFLQGHRTVCSCDQLTMSLKFMQCKLKLL